MAIIAYSPKSRRPLPSQERLRALFRYEPASGFLFWNPIPATSFRAVGFNARFAEKPAGAINPRGGYLIIYIDRVGYYAHRLVWKWHFGTEPETIDHIDRDKLNNRIENLREANHKIQMLNRGLFRSNTTGHRHISVETHGNKRFSVVIDRKRIGRFYTLEEAIEARDRAYQNVR